MKRRRVLLVGTSSSAVPLLLALRKMGFSVAVCGAYEKDPCIPYADAYHNMNYADQDALLHLVRTSGYEMICPSCNDYAYLSAAHVAHHLGLPGYDNPEATRILHDKAAFRDHASKIGLPVPVAISVASDHDLRDILDDLPTFPLMVKPVDSFSGRGVIRVDTQTALTEAVSSARAISRCGRIVIEHFVEGTLHSHSAFIEGGRIKTDYFVDEFCQTYPYQVDCSNAPSRVDESVRNAMRVAIIELCISLKLTDGLIHTQFISGAEGIQIIESMRRCPGDLFHYLVSLSSGAPYIDNYLAPFVKRSIQKPLSGEYMQYWLRHTVSFDTDRIFLGLERLPGDTEDLRIYPLARSGDHIPAAPYGKAAILFARFADKNRLLEMTPRIASIINIVSEKFIYASNR